MLVKNTEKRYGLVAILMHWLMAVIVIGMLCVGLYMTGLPSGPQKLQIYGWHKEFGILILMLVCFRICWRLGNISPIFPASLAKWQKLAAHAGHYALYFFMFAMPLTGWMMSSSADYSVSFFGLFIMPNLVGPNKPLHELMVFLHEWFAYGLIAMVCLHFIAALQHHFYYKDDTLRRIVSWKK
tara:strand:- start:25 stop:573 length:549 start_codon:yes stop_codon:yes gene_type:complete